LPGRRERAGHRSAAGVVRGRLRSDTGERGGTGENSRIATPQHRRGHIVDTRIFKRRDWRQPPQGSADNEVWVLSVKR
jgi:hypothetical protein